MAIDYQETGAESGLEPASARPVAAGVADPAIGDRPRRGRRTSRAVELRLSETRPRCILRENQAGSGQM